VERNSTWLFNLDGSVKRYKFPKFPDEIEQKSDAFYLFDPAGKLGAREPRRIYVFTIVAASPDPALYHQFNKRIGNKKYYMPCWSRDEIFSIIDYFPDIDKNTVEKLFEKYGGIPRFVLSKSDDWNAELQLAIKSANIDELQKSIGGPELLSDTSHKVLQYGVDSNYRESTVKFASQYIADKVSEKLLEDQISKTSASIQLMARYPEIASLRGSIFENYAHKVLGGNGKWTVKALAENKTEELELKNKKTGFFDSLEDLDISEEIYYRPNNKNFGALDSFIRKGNVIYFFQMTVSTNHPVSNAAIENAIKKIDSKTGRMNYKLIFITPPDVFSNFRHQHYLNKENKIIQPNNLEKIIRDVGQWVLELKLTP
jgi:hypothetical protein